MEKLTKHFQPAVITVGDELILGERQNENERWLLQLLWSHNCAAHVTLSLPDQVTVIAHWLQQVWQASCYPILVSGGIGGTHDDCTREGIAQALQVPLVQHEECFHILQQRYGDRFNAQRQRMAWLPQGSSLIANPFGAPGFAVQGIFAFPGFPHMLHAMTPPVLEQVLGTSDATGSWLLEEVELPVSEGDIAMEIEQFSQAWPQVRLGIYAHASGTQRSVTLRLRYPPTVTEALPAFQKLVDQLDPRKA